MKTAGPLAMIALGIVMFVTGLSPASAGVGGGFDPCDGVGVVICPSSTTSDVSTTIASSTTADDADLPATGTHVDTTAYLGVVLGTSGLVLLVLGRRRRPADVS